MENFLWGVSTSAHQVEGGNFGNDWWEFEQQGSINDDSSSHPSCDHYRRSSADFRLLKSLGCNAYRFSLEWSRLEPSEGEFSLKGLGHYHRVLDTLLDLRVTPLVTLHHFTNPLWVKQQGGWENPAVVDFFGEYVRKVVEEYAEKVTWWVTINEPNVLLLLGYLLKYWPPQRGNLLALIRAFKNLVQAHRLAYQIIHSKDSEAKVSIAHHMSVLDPWRNNGLDNLVTCIYDWIWNRSFLNSVSREIDFIGLNYYTRQRVSFPLRLFPTPGKEAGFAQWEIYPQGLLRVLQWLRAFRLPIVVTEFGMPQEANVKPEDYLKEGFNMLRQALSEDINVQGFFYWSLLDNFEWREGLSKRFGLFEVNYQTQERKLRRVGEVYRRLIGEL